MEVITSAKVMQEQALAWKKAGKIIGFAPTMGFLHDGHMSLYARATKENDVVVGSIFVNPIQFGPTEDFADYPRDLAKDKDLCESQGVDCLFIPEVSEMYPQDFDSYVNVQGLDKYLCGACRPGHFRGVATVVLKLFNICQPDRAYFGQKDIQQLTILQKMVKDLNLPVEICRVPILREKDGLAISSRNVYLSSDEREQAPGIYAALCVAQTLIDNGEREAAKIIEQAVAVINGKVSLGVIDYLEIVGAKTLCPLKILQGDVIMAVAVKLPHARLIDNICIKCK